MQAKASASFRCANHDETRNVFLVNVALISREQRLLTMSRGLAPLGPVT